MKVRHLAVHQAITEAGKPQEKAQHYGGHGTLIAALQIYGIAVAVAEAPGTQWLL